MHFAAAAILQRLFHPIKCRTVLLFEVASDSRQASSPLKSCSYFKSYMKMKCRNSMLNISQRFNGQQHAQVMNMTNAIHCHGFILQVLRENIHIYPSWALKQKIPIPGSRSYFIYYLNYFTLKDWNERISFSVVRNTPYSKMASFLVSFYFIEVALHVFFLGSKFKSTFQL